MTTGRPVTTTVGEAAEPRKWTSADARIHIPVRPEYRFSQAGRITAWKVYGLKKSVTIASVSSKNAIQAQIATISDPSASILCCYNKLHFAIISPTLATLKHTRVDFSERHC